MNKIIKTLLTTITMIFFLGCGDNTESPLIKDIKSIQIDDGNIYMYSTDQFKTLSASVTYTDSTTKLITNSDMWKNSNYDVLRMSSGVITPVKNGGNSTVSIQIGNLSDSIDVNIIKLVDFNISYGSITTVGDHLIEAIGTFENNQTKKVYRNIIWETNNTSLVRTDENYITTLSLVSGETNLTATVFRDDNETNITKSVIFSIN